MRVAGINLKLPKTWQWEKCGLIIDVRDGTHDTPKYQNTGYPLITSKNLKPEGIDFSTASFISESDYLEINKRSAVDKNDILFAMIGTIGNPVIVDTELEFSIKNVALFKFGKSPIDTNYFKYLLETPIIKRQLELEKRGGTQKFVSLKVLRNMMIPYPPIDEQRRIAAILDQADAIRRKRQQAIALTDELLRSTFLEMFGDPVINPKGWEVCKIKDVAEVKTGKTPSRNNPENYGGRTRWVKTTEVRDSVITETEEHLTEKGAYQMNIFPKNSILVAMYGQGVTRGRTALLGKPCTTNQACAVILPNKSYCPIYLWTLLRLSYEQIREMGRGGNQPNLNLSMIKNFDFPLPPLEKQKRFRLFVNIFNSQSNHVKASKHLNNNLFNSLLQRAFKGQL